MNQSKDNRYDLIVFDFDNTLFDYEKTEIKALKDVFSELGFLYKPEHSVIFSNINRSLWDKSEIDGSFDKNELRKKRFFEFFNEIGLLTDNSLANRASQIFIHRSTEGHIIEGVEETLYELKKRDIILIIASSGLSNPRKAKLFNSPIKKIFSSALFREDFLDNKIKPHKDFYNEISRRYKGIQRERILYVGDSFEPDVKGSKISGFSNVWFNYFKVKESNVEMEYCDSVIYNFKDLILLI